MNIAATIGDLRRQVAAWRVAGKTVALVPTMGNLHAGHLSLVEDARRRADRVVVSVFVNPTQFGPQEDFAAYPRTPADDVRQLEAVGADLLFMPSVEAMYPRPAAGMTYVEVPELADRLCGQFRPGHFRGVATVVLKLFHQVQPDLALFGEKDYQQLTVIRRLVDDLDLPVRIVGVPTVREPDGLAMSSRNAYLSAEERPVAALIFRQLGTLAEALQGGDRDFSGLEAGASEVLVQAGFAVDYVAIRRARDLQAPDEGDTDLVVLVAARLDRTRLIDNIRVCLAPAA